MVLCFFSSRRRHTRYWRDWSSDVCSSDLFAALEVATGKVTEACTDRHRHQEFLAFLKQVAAAYPRRQLHVVVDKIGRASCRERGVDLGGRRIIKKKNN